MAKRGRPSGFNASLKSRIVELVEQGKTLDQVGEIIGVSRQTIHNWCGQHKDLLYAVREARQVADELVEASLFSRAVGYSHPEQKVFCDKGEIITHDMIKHHPPDTQAAVFWLRNRQPERWKEKSEGDVTVNNHLHVDKLTDEQLEAKIAALLAKNQPATEDAP